MPNVIQHKRNSTAGIIPSTGSLAQGELGINIGDGKLYTKNSSNVVINLGVTSISGTTITPASGNFNYLAVSGATVLTGVGTSGYLSKFNSSQTVANSLIYDNGTNVGIGTGVQATTPPEKLTVDGNIRVADTAGTQGNVVQFSRGGGTQYDYSIGRYGSALAISLAADSSSQRPFQVGYHSGATFNPKFHINGYTGDVGMGTVTPSHRLQLGTTTSTSTATPETISLGGTYSSSAGGNAKLRLWTDGSNVMGLGVSSNQLDYVCSAGYSHVFYNNGSERMRIASNGNVGIGTASPHPSYTLNVAGGILINGSTTAGLYPSILGLGSTVAVTGGGEGYGISFRYNVIGSGSSDVSNFIGYDGAGVSWTKGTSGTISSAHTALFSAPTIATNNYALRTDGTTVLCVTTGNVGIGTTSPQALLHVNGQAYLQSLNLTNGTADRILATDTNKNVVGLNTSTYPTLTELSYVKGVASSIQAQINTKIAYGEYSQSNPVFGQKGIKHNIVDNVLYSASDRFEFYIDNALQSNNSLFNLGYDQVAAALLPNATKIFRLVFNTKSNSATGITHPEGSVYLSFYYNATPASVSGRVKDKDGVWRNITNWTNVATNAPFYAVWRGTVPNNLYLVEMELTVVGGSVAIIGGDATWLSQIEYVMDRPGQFELGVLNKAQDTTLWRNINFKNNSNTTTLSLTSAGNINLTSSTASRILSTDGSKNITALDTATYPSLTELSYVKGTTSSIQTQINSKQNTLTNPVTGTGTTGKIPKWSSTTALTDSIMSESSTIVNIAGSLNGQSDDSYLSFDANARRIGITKKGGFTGKFTYGSGSSFAIAQSNSGTIEATNTFTDRLVIDSGGNVGIGTATPGSKLEVNGEIAAGGISAFTFAGNAWGYDKIIFRKDVNNKITTDSSGNYNWLVAGKNWTLSDVGNVGIGTTVPDAKLVVSSSTDANSVLWERGGASGTVFGHYFRATANNATTFKKAGIVFENGSNGYSNGKLHILNRGGIDDTNATVANAARITVLNNGDVGIGTTTPSDKLNVIGNISAGTTSNTKGNFIAYGSAGQPNLLFEGFGSDGTARISTNSGSNRQLKIENDGASTTLGVYIEGDVGIGTTTPAYKLQVNGSFAASTKSFRIHHPSKKDHSLEYGSLESPYHGVRLTGRGSVLKGVGIVSLPDYLKDLIHDDDTLNIQITNIKHGKTIYIDKIDLQNDQFIVKVDRAKSLGELQFCWTLTGVRKDVDHLVVEKEN